MDKLIVDERGQATISSGYIRLKYTMTELMYGLR
jgi:hypothetical protein